MRGLGRALGRLLIMGAVMAGVVVASLVAGVATTIALALGIFLAGLVGLAGVARRDAVSTPTASPSRTGALAVPGGPAAPARATAVEAMSPAGAETVDPEANMPRWRRPSLLEARRADPRRPTDSSRPPLRFSDQDAVDGDVRLVHYAVVPVLDQPDEILGLRLADLGTGDEIRVVAASGAFLEVVCPDGVRGWIHRTTVRQAVSPSSGSRPEVPAEAEDVLTALLAARGLQ